MSNHTKRTHSFYIRVLELAQKLMGVHTKMDLMQAAKILAENTTDSQCMSKASEIEPVFVLRAKDPCAAVALASWIEEAKKRGLHKDKLSGAVECLKEFLGFKPN